MTWAPHPSARRLTPAEEAFYTQQVLAQMAQRRPAYLNERNRAAHEAARQRGLSGGANLDAVVAVGAVLFVGMTVASYYLVRGVAPKKSANAYGGAAAASNILFPLVGPIVVGIVAANADGKR